MSNMKRYWEQVCIELFGVVTPEYLEKARPIAQARLHGLAGKERDARRNEEVSSVRSLDVPSEMD